MIQSSMNRMKKEFNSMSVTEKKIAGFILQHPEEVISMPIKKLARQVEVSEGSIINFSTKIGFSGFSQLKLDIAKNLRDPQSAVFENVSEKDTPKMVVKKMMEKAQRSFMDTYAILDGQDLQRAADMLINVQKRVEIYGVGSSSMIATDAYYRFLRIGLPAFAVTDPHIASVSASLLDEDCVAFAVSHSGETIETLNAMKIAKSRHAKTICITSYSQSPLVDLCDVSIVISALETKMNKEAVTSRLTQLLIIDSLTNYVAYHSKTNSVEVMCNVIDILSEHRVQSLERDEQA